MRKFIDFLVALAVAVSLWLTSGAPAPAQTPVVPGSVSQPANGNSQAFQAYSAANPQPVTGNSAVITYSASANFANSSAGDAYCVNGSASKLVSIKEIRVTATASAQVVANISLVRRSTADTGGGLTAITAVASDSTNASATASASYFTSAPTAGTLVGRVRDRFLTISATATSVVTVSEGLFQFKQDQAQMLRGAAQGLCVSVPSTAGGSWSIYAEWTEQ